MVIKAIHDFLVAASLRLGEQKGGFAKAGMQKICVSCQVRAGPGHSANSHPAANTWSHTPPPSFLQ